MDVHAGRTSHTDEGTAWVTPLRAKETRDGQEAVRSCARGLKRLPGQPAGGTASVCDLEAALSVLCYSRRGRLTPGTAFRATRTSLGAGVRKSLPPRLDEGLLLLQTLEGRLHSKIVLTSAGHVTASACVTVSDCQQRSPPALTSERARIKSWERQGFEQPEFTF